MPQDSKFAAFLISVHISTFGLATFTFVNFSSLIIAYFLFRATGEFHDFWQAIVTATLLNSNQEHPLNRNKNG